MSSVQSKILTLLLRIIRRRRRYGTIENVRAFIANKRPKYETPPPKKLKSKFQVEEREEQGKLVFTIKPKKHSTDLHVLYLHGGAYINVIVKQHWNFIFKLVEMTSCSVTVPLYGLAPEYTCKDAYGFITPIYGDLVEEHGAENLVLMGDSAGGGLVLGLGQSLSAQRLPQPRSIVLLSPWLDATLSNPDIATLESSDPMLSSPGLREAGRMWAGNWAIDDFRLSPIYGPISELAPICIFIGTNDILLADARKFRQAALSETISLGFFEYSNMMHVWMLLSLPESRQVLRQIAAFINKPMRNTRYRDRTAPHKATLP